MLCAVYAHLQPLFSFADRLCVQRTQELRVGSGVMCCYSINQRFYPDGYPFGGHYVRHQIHVKNAEAARIYIGAHKFVADC